MASYIRKEGYCSVSYSEVTCNSSKPRTDDYLWSTAICSLSMPWRQGWAGGCPDSASACAGYKSVAHYLVLTHQAEAEALQADSASAAAPEEAAAASAGAEAVPAPEQPAGKGNTLSRFTMQDPEIMGRE